jgi:hypothetical protein
MWSSPGLRLKSRFILNRTIDTRLDGMLSYIDDVEVLRSFVPREVLQQLQEIHFDRNGTIMAIMV